MTLSDFLPSFLKPQQPSPAHTEVRYVAATSAENKLARRKAIDRQLELAVAVCHLTPEQREAAKDRALSRAKALAEGKGVRR